MREAIEDEFISSYIGRIKLESKVLSGLKRRLATAVLSDATTQGLG